MIEYLEGVHWQNKSIVSQPHYEVARLVNSPIFKKNVNESISFCTAKGQKMLTSGMRFGDLYEKYHDIDDNMLYLRLVRENPFG